MKKGQGKKERSFWGAVCTQEGVGLLRCVLSATDGVGGVSKSGKSAYVINGRPLYRYIDIDIYRDIEIYRYIYIYIYIYM